MKILTKEDFEEINKNLVWMEVHTEVFIEQIEELVPKIEDEKLREEFERIFKEYYKIEKDTMEGLNKFRNELWKKGVLNKGLRF